MKYLPFIAGLTAFIASLVICFMLLFTPPVPEPVVFGATVRRVAVIQRGTDQYSMRVWTTTGEVFWVDDHDFGLIAEGRSYLFRVQGNVLISIEGMMMEATE